MITILKYNAGNIRSVQNALERLGYESIITDDPQLLKSSKKLIIPGVGEASSAMKYLKEKQLHTLIPTLEQPVLGICLGLQLLCEYSEEGETSCLGIFNHRVRKFPKTDLVPHMGWNHFTALDGALSKDISADENVYYVHSYYAGLGPQTKSVCTYMLPFSATLEKNNFYATQFHPEKSASIGERILLNFLEL
jgi:imidazole glycerol-phosphate synthase subunit HisH